LALPFGVRRNLTAEHLSDERRGKNTQLPLADLFRQSVYSRMAGYEDVRPAAANSAARFHASTGGWGRRGVWEGGEL
jgi:hypothetical protein